MSLPCWQQFRSRLQLEQRTKKLHQNGTFHSRNIAFHVLPKQLKLVRTSQNQFGAVSVQDIKGNSVAYRITSALDFNKRSCVRPI